MSASLDIVSNTAAAEAVIDPKRRAVLRALREPGSATSVGQALGLPRQKVNYHLRALERVGLVRHVEDRRRGNCTERIVRATATHYLIDSSLLGDLGQPMRDPAGETSSRHLAAVAAKTVADVGELERRARDAGKRLATFSAEAGIRFASPADQAEFVEELSSTVAALAARYHTEDADHGRWFRIVVGAHPALPDTTEEASDDE